MGRTPWFAGGLCGSRQVSGGQLPWSGVAKLKRGRYLEEASPRRVDVDRQLLMKLTKLNVRAILTRVRGWKPRLDGMGQLNKSPTAAVCRLLPSFENSHSTDQHSSMSFTRLDLSQALHKLHKYSIRDTQVKGKLGFVAQTHATWLCKPREISTCSQDQLVATVWGSQKHCASDAPFHRFTGAPASCVIRPREGHPCHVQNNMLRHFLFRCPTNGWRRRQEALLICICVS
jgi:hypothetical protein